jgi:hypothetical protein
MRYTLRIRHLTLPVVNLATHYRFATFTDVDVLDDNLLLTLTPVSVKRL